ncbi:MAG TPA: SRPBCC domain-containing protein [Casimicrobiaceae bacterium]|nr:SRPBCC domain-containing protein [Casimicrobiaceae bacterium]
MKTAIAASALAPIVVDLVVGCTPVAAFDYFTRDIGRWWPLASHSVGGEHAKDVRFEPHVGGRIVETIEGGTECVWGTVETWQPGERLRFSWHPGREPATAQWVEVTFAPNPTGTRVTLTHGGWERYGERAGDARTNYLSGWAVVVRERYADYCDGGADARA